jgi:acyl carrier protein
LRFCCCIAVLAPNFYQSDYGRYYGDSLVITRNVNAKTVPDRNSLAHVNLVTAIEKKYKIKFGLAEPQELKNAGDTIELIEKKVAPK